MVDTPATTGLGLLDGFLGPGPDRKPLRRCLHPPCRPAHRRPEGGSLSPALRLGPESRPTPVMASSQGSVATANKLARWPSRAQRAGCRLRAGPTSRPPWPGNRVSFITLFTMAASSATNPTAVPNVDGGTCADERADVVAGAAVPSPKVSEFERLHAEGW